MVFGIVEILCLFVGGGGISVDVLSDIWVVDEVDGFDVGVV